MTMNEVESFFGSDKLKKDLIVEPSIDYPESFINSENPEDVKEFLQSFMGDFNKYLAIYIAKFNDKSSMKLEMKMHNDGRSRITIALTPEWRIFLNTKAKDLYNKLQSVNGDTSLVSCIQGKYNETAFLHIANGLFSFCGLKKSFKADHNIYGGNSGDLEDFRIGSQIIDVKHRNDKVNKGYMDNVDYLVGNNRNIVFFTGDDRYNYSHFINVCDISYKCILGGMFDDSLWVESTIKKNVRFGSKIIDRRVLDPGQMYDVKKTIMFLFYHAMLEQDLV